MKNLNSFEIDIVSGGDVYTVCDVIIDDTSSEHRGDVIFRGSFVRNMIEDSEKNELFKVIARAFEGIVKDGYRFICYEADPEYLSEDL